MKRFLTTSFCLLGISSGFAQETYKKFLQDLIPAVDMPQGLTLSNDTPQARYITEVAKLLGQANLETGINGMYREQQVETVEKRPLKILTVSQKEKLGIDIETLAFANFRHDGEFYIGQIEAIKVDSNNKLRAVSPKGSIVEELFVAKEHWNHESRPALSSLEAHAEVLIRFKEESGVKLVYNQSANEGLTEAQIAKNKSDFGTIKGIVYSTEAIRGADSRDAFFLPGALGFNFAIAKRVYSLSERAKRYQADKHARFTVYPINFNQARKKKGFEKYAISNVFVFNAISESDEIGVDLPYHMFYSNCMNNMIDTFDNSVETYNKALDDNDVDVKNKKNINVSQIKRVYDDWKKQDLQQIAGFLKAMAASSGQVEEMNSYIQSLPISVDWKKKILNAIKNQKTTEAIARKIGRGINKKIMNYGKSEKTIDEFLKVTAGLPMVIDGQIWSRGLVPTSVDILDLDYIKKEVHLTDFAR